MGLPYLIDQLSVDSDAVLTIEPGVRVLALPGNDGLDVQGRLVAVGTAGKEIHLDAASWTVTALPDLATALGSSGTHRFALDPQNRPRMLDLTSDGLALLSCDANCSGAGNWNAVVIFNGQVYSPQLHYTAAGKAVAIFEDFSGTVYYGECTANCSLPAQWTFLAVVALGSSGESYDLKLDSQGRPRFAFFSGATE